MDIATIIYKAKLHSQIKHIEFLQSICKNKEVYLELEAIWVKLTGEYEGL